MAHEPTASNRRPCRSAVTASFRHWARVRTKVDAECHDAVRLGALPCLCTTQPLVMRPSRRRRTTKTETLVQE